MEQADAQGLQRRIVLAEDDEVQRRAGALNDQRGEQDVLDKAHHALPGVQVGGLPDQVAALQVQLAARGQDDAGAHGGDAQAPHLDEHGQDELPQGREGVAGVHGDKAGDAHGAGGGVQRVDVGEVHALPHAEGEDQQHRAQQDHHCEAQRDQPHRGLCSEETFHSSFSPFIR